MKADVGKRREEGSSRSRGDAGMAFPGSRWEETPPETEGVDSRRLERALRHLGRKSGRDGISEVVVARNGRIIWRGNRAALRHNVWSCTKPFTSTILGLLIDQGECGLDTPAMEHLPELAPLYPEVRLRHFASMTSGYDGGGDQSRYPFAPSPPLFPPGTWFLYWDSAMNQFLNVLTRIAGEPAREIFRRSIAEPIGMNPSGWGWEHFDTTGDVLLNGGAGNQGKGIHICAFDIARFGHLFLNRGRWEGRQLLSESWVDLATTSRVPVSIRPWAERSIDGPGEYGFNWWTNGIRTDGRRRWPAAPQGTYAACGFNNNRCFVIPEWGMVIARLGRDGNVKAKVYNRFFRLLAKAL